MGTMVDQECLVQMVIQDLVDHESKTMDITGEIVAKEALVHQASMHLLEQKPAM